ncbi:hypothetical protein [Massilia sp. DD77]|uniref:hypothetical protein n=1 Tax=Massilia sp. DD77 TaxID=3109349 RepID=UPI002FFFB0B9
MAFADKYMGALSASNLLDDELHHKAEPLQAAALADRSARDIGALLHRVKYAGTVVQKLAHAVAAQGRAERELADAVRRKDTAREAECRQVVEANAATCAMAGSEAAAFRSLYVAWCDIVSKKGAERHWIKPADWPKIGHLAPALYRRVAEHSLVYYLDDVCKACDGTGATSTKPLIVCKTCCGSRKQPLGSAAELKISAYEAKLVAEMVGELLALEQTHAGVANARLRRV